MQHKQLTLKERYHISTLLKREWRQKEIAESIGVHPSTICRELQRNSDPINNEYSYEFAYTLAKKRQQEKPKYTVINKSTKRYIRDKLKEDWSSEQIAGRMRIDTGMVVCHETIYRYIYINKTHGGKLPLKVIALLTDLKEHYRNVPWMVTIEPTKENGLNKISAIDFFQVRSVSEKRLTKRVGKVDSSILVQ